MKPIFLPLKAAAIRVLRLETSVSSTRKVPEVGLSRQPMRFKRVVLPLPEGPTKETKEAGSISKFRSFNASTFHYPFAYAFDRLFAVTKFMGLFLQKPQYTVRQFASKTHLVPHIWGCLSTIRTTMKHPDFVGTDQSTTSAARRSGRGATRVRA